LRAAPPKPLTGARVLLVDDSDDNLEVTGRLLQRAGATVATARHGGEALERLAAEPQGHDLVLMDLQMPVLDGLQTTRLLRAEPALRHLPVIGLSASALASDRQRALDAGMEALVTKPFEPALLIERVQRRLGLHPVRPGPSTRPESAGSPGAPEPLRAPATTAPDNEWPQIDGLDLAGARRRLQDDLTLWRRLVRQMLATHRPAIRPDDDLDTRQRRMHRLAGAAGLIGAEDVRQAAMAAEAALRDVEASPTACDECLARVEGALAQFEARTQGLLGGARETPGLDATPSAIPVRIDDWLATLAANDLAALEQFDRLAETLKLHLAPAAYPLLEAAMQRLDFPEAARLWRAAGIDLDPRGGHAPVQAPPVAGATAASGDPA
jgi:CheY-like chemotaxis protein/HPt (histidine-containing phosphotransfer) domain-containing protein